MSCLSLGMSDWVNGILERDLPWLEQTQRANYSIIQKRKDNHSTILHTVSYHLPGIQRRRNQNLQIASVAPTERKF